MSPEDSEETGYDLVMPFVACVSNGGPFDDDAFTAGYQAGGLDKALEILAAAGGCELRATVNAALMPQLDLIAMRHGFRLDSEACAEAEGWAFVTFTTSETAK